MKPAEKYDAIIVGAGMSGLAAGIRLAHYGRKVAILECHHRIGGMNSWYRRAGREFDVGLHAMTNFSRPGERGRPLDKLLRQLRLPYRNLDLVEQNHSLISFPGAELRFSNDFRELESAVADRFPRQIDSFRRLVAKIDEFPSLAFDAPRLSARRVLEATIAEPLLREMIICPLMYYGNPAEHDMQFAQFCIMFQSIFQEGFCRPRNGMRPLLERLAERYREAGGELYTKCGVRRLHTRNRQVNEAELDDGRRLQAEAVLSCAGYPETMALCADDEAAAPRPRDAVPGPMSFLEAIFVCDRPSLSTADAPSIIFQSEQAEFSFRNPRQRADQNSAVICLPDNFQVPEPAWQERNEARVRVTRIADYQAWARLPAAEYRQAKQEMLCAQLRSLSCRFGDLEPHLQASDLFTPLTVERYTGRRQGAIYGTTEKQRNGRTPFENLFLCGTDQGFLGIVGALLSGVSMANLHFFGKQPG